MYRVDLCGNHAQATCVGDDLCHFKEGEDDR